MTELPSYLIDAHTHFFYNRSYYDALFRERVLRVVVINITGGGLLDDSMEARWEAMLEVKQRYPEHVVLCTTFEPEGITKPAFADKIIAKLRGDLRQGASLVKVWKDIGLEVQEEDGTWVQIDDARFDPIWEFLADEGVPVIAHIAEPRAAWQPLDRRSPHFRYYHDHPHHHLYRRNNVPAWQELIEARDRWIEKNPGLTIIGAHFGSMAHDVREVARRLDRYPNFYVDTSERFGDLVIQPSERVRRFFEQYTHRILYGTDVLLTDPVLSDENEHAAYESLLADHWEYLAGEGTIAVQDKLVEPVTTEALGLSAPALEKVYRGNAERLLDDPTGSD